MKLIFENNDEREIMRKLCDYLATTALPSIKSAHVILKSALDNPDQNKPVKPLTQFNDLLGVTLREVENQNNEEIIFTLADGRRCKLYHSQDCCETVLVEDICGDLNDLIGSPILQAEENNNADTPETFKPGYKPESMTWTFYRIATAKGQVVIRWLGESNGYYSESVDFVQL